ncbi:MAG: methylisocitrate lyase [Alphaproteobacteria bacterium]|jgi:2-methylisocitrate lyase-like PEP mutase family enzyme
MKRPTEIFRSLLQSKDFIYLPAVYYPLAGKLMESVGFSAAYVGGYVTGGSLAVSEPLVTLTEQVEVASSIANAVSLPIICDAGAGFGEPLHVTRAVAEFIRAGVSGIHIEDQLYPKRAHYHKYVAHAIEPQEFEDKIKWACRTRDKHDKDFVIIARSDTCRFLGLDEAMSRINRAADVGADLGMVFPTSHEEAVRAPKESSIPLVYVISRGNRDGRPLYSPKQLEDMGYKAGIDAQLYLLLSFHFARQAMTEMKENGVYTGLSNDEFMGLRQDVEDLIGMDSFYEIEEETVENTKWGKR